MRAFNNNDTITSVTLPEGLEIIGHYAFYSCEKLETINFPDSLTTIGESAFRFAKMLGMVIKR